MKITIRSYKESDFEEVYSLVASIFAVELSGVPAEGYLSDIEDAIGNYAGDDQDFWVAIDKDKDKIIGMVGVKNEYEKVAMLRRVFVHPEYRARGVAKQLFSKVKHFCKKRNYEEIVFLGNQEMHVAKIAMLKLGFREIDNVQVGLVSMFKLAYTV